MFDADNLADLDQIAELDSQLIADFNQAVAALAQKISERRKFQLTLSLALGKTLAEIEQMPEEHLTEYQLFYQKQPFGLWRED